MGGFGETDEADAERGAADGGGEAYDKLLGMGETDDGRGPNKSAHILRLSAMR